MRRTMNPLNPALMTTDERLSEVTAILARGLVRLRARQSNELSRPGGDSFVDFPPDQRGHVSAPTRTENAA